LILHGFARWTFIAVQVLDGPPGLTTRRLSSFLLIPVGNTGRDLHFLARIFRNTEAGSHYARWRLLLRASSCHSSSCRPTRSIPRFPLPEMYYEDEIYYEDSNVRCKTLIPRPARRKAGSPI
jgi:hypothetical protein